MNYDIRNDVMPVGIYTCNGLTGEVTRGMDLSIPAKVQINSTTVDFSPPNKFGFFHFGDFTKNRLTDISTEIMLSSGTKEDEFTRLVYQQLQLPNWVRVAAVVKMEMSQWTAMEIRPISLDERVAVSRAIAELKSQPHSRENGEKIRSLVNRLKQFNVGEEKDLFPFVVPVYPTRIEGQKVLSYRVFLVTVGWDVKNKKWKEKTSFEVITTTNPNGNNFIINTEFKVDSEGVVTSNVTLENRWVKAARRAAELK